MKRIKKIQDVCKVAILVLFIGLIGVLGAYGNNGSSMSCAFWFLFFLVAEAGAWLMLFFTEWVKGLTIRELDWLEDMYGYDNESVNGYRTILRVFKGYNV